VIYVRVFKYTEPIEVAGSDEFAKLVKILLSFAREPDDEGSSHGDTRNRFADALQQF
jgi:hypothetical protein